MNFKSVNLETVTNNLDYRRKPLNDRERVALSKNKLYPYCGANNILDYIDEYIFDEATPILCVAEDGGDWSKGKKCCYIMNEKCWVNNHVHVLTMKNDIDVRYVYYYLNHSDLTKYITGSTRGKLTKSALSKINIFLPSMEIQQKIADTLDLASELIEKRKEQIAEMDKLIQSVFYEMFGDPNKLSKECKINLKRVATITTGNTPSRKELKNYGNHMEWIKTDNMSFDSLYPSRAAEYLSEIGVNKARIADKKSILMTCIAGSKKSIGKVVLLDRAVAFNQQINAITMNDKINVKYLFYTLKFSKIRLEDFANDSMKKMITKSKLENFEINNVGMEKQLKFASIVEEIESQKKIMEESLHEMENNFNALMQKAFRGELFPEE